MFWQDTQVSWDLRSLLHVFWPWPWVASLVTVVAVIGLAIYMKLQKSKRRFTANSSSSK
jgi:hypothetical protein